MVGDGDSESLAGCWWYREGDNDGDSSTERPEAVLVMVFALAMGMLTALESHSCWPGPGLPSSRAQARQRAPQTRTEASDVD